MARIESTFNSEFCFIIGCQKSGTTWLRDCYRYFISIGAPEWYFPLLAYNISSVIERFGGFLPSNELKEIRSRAVRAAWLEVVQSNNGDKSAYPCAPEELVHPVYREAIPIARDFFPDSKIVMIIRDPRAVFLSLYMYYKNTGNKFADELDAKDFAKNWVLNNEKWVQDGPDSLIKYEDMKLTFKETLTKSFSEVGIIATDTAMEAIYDAEYDLRKNRNKQPEIYRTGEINEWQHTLENSTIQSIEEVAHQLMGRFDYATVT